MNNSLQSNTLNRMIKKGVRVIRGPNWKWGNQDTGAGHIGTITGISDDEERVTVEWDNQEVLQLCEYIQSDKTGIYICICIILILFLNIPKI